MALHISQFADSVRCVHCNEVSKTLDWPIRGDYVPFYYQKEKGNYNLTVTCPQCQKEWYIVWDQDPGPIKKILSFI